MAGLPKRRLARRTPKARFLALEAASEQETAHERRRGALAFQLAREFG
jgi:hypothetical protein